MSSENNYTQALKAKLQNLKTLNQYRMLKVPNAKAISFCDNDYLGLLNDRRVIEAAHGCDTGAGASRYVSGNHHHYKELERLIAEHRNCAKALVFSSGFAMNNSVIPALTSKDDIILADKLCHASLIDGAKASQSKTIRFAHNDIESLHKLLKIHRANAKECFIITESVFSMDGDVAPLMQILELAKTYNCQLIIDDAHGLGFVEIPKHDRIIVLGTLSKAIGTLGGYICANRTVIDYVTNHCRALIYSTALPPVVIVASIRALSLIIAEPYRAAKAIVNARYFCEQMNLPLPHSPIVPYIVNDSDKAILLSDALAEYGFLVIGIRPPTVPKNSARLRFSFSARHELEQIDALVKAFKECLRNV